MRPRRGADVRPLFEVNQGLFGRFPEEGLRGFQKVRLGGPQRALSAFALDELDRLLLSHPLAAVASPRPRQPTREGDSDEVAIHNRLDDRAARLLAPINSRKCNSSGSSA